MKKSNSVLVRAGNEFRILKTWSQTKIEENDNVCFVVKDEARNEWRFYIQEGQESKTELIAHFDVVNGGYVDENVLKCIDRYMISDYVFLGIICYVETDSFRIENDDK